MTAADYTRLAFEASLRSLDKQEAVLTELRSRTGILLAASSVAASLLGGRALTDASIWLVIPALAAFVVSVGLSLYILLPKRNQFTFSQSGPGLYEGLFEFKQRMPEVYRRLAYDLERFWFENDRGLTRMFRAFELAAVTLVIEIGFLVVAVTYTL